MKKAFSFFFAIFLLAGSTSLFAETTEAKKTPARAKKDLSTNVVGSQEAPTVLNVVPWKEREVRYERKSPIRGILEQSLQPLDRDVVMREIQYHDSLQSQRSP